MKYSIHNSYIGIDEKNVLIYNAFSQRYIVLEKSALFYDGSKELHNINTINANLKEILQKHGYIVGKDINESKMLKKKIDDIDNNDSSFILHINPTLDCNFHCWYCYENHIKDSMMNPDTLKSVKKYILKILGNKQIKNFSLHFFGGEPLIGYNQVMKPLITYIAGICAKSGIKFQLGVTSNAFLLTNEIATFVKDFDTYFQITLDGDRDCHDKVRFSSSVEGSYDKIIENIKMLAAMNINVIVRINFTLKNIDSVNNIVKDFADLNDNAKHFINIDLQRVWQDVTSECDEHQIQQKVQNIALSFKNIGLPVSNHTLMNYVNSSCYGDKKNYLLINYDGLVYHCTARDFNRENAVGILKNGTVVLDKEKSRIRDACKFKRSICQTCRIAPICGGGCKQKAFETQDYDGCIYNYSETDKDNLILHRFEQLFVTQHP